MRTSLPFLAPLFSLLAFVQLTFAQPKMQYTKGSSGTVCYLDTRSMHTVVPAPESYRLVKSGARTKSADIEVTYEGFTTEARNSFEAAVNIWESLLTSEVTIHVLARWAPLGNGVLGGASAGGYIMNFDGAQRTGIWYPVALAEKLARKELNGASTPDIVATFNSTNSSWHYGLDGDNPPAGKYDLMSVVLHEIGHGLGLNKSYEMSGSDGTISSFFSGRPVVYETNLESVDNKNLVTSFAAPSTALGLQLTSNVVYYNSPLVLNVSSNDRARVYAPTTFAPGSSIAHLDEGTYPAGTPNSLMTPNIGAAERILDPGPIVKQILKEMGWLTTNIQHTPLKGREDNTSPFEVKCKVTSDTSFDLATLSLNYSTDGTNFTTVPMSATGTPTEFNAFIPNGSSKYYYFIKLTDVDSRIITKPGTEYVQNSPTKQSVFTFEVGPDTKAPYINHVPVPFMSTFDTLRIEAVISDNLGISEAKIDWDINGAAQTSLLMEVKPGTDSTYFSWIVFPSGSLADGNKIHYRITAKDNAVAHNAKSIPSASTFYEVNVTGLAPARDSYANDFNDMSDADFFGTGFSITKPAGFENGAIHSEHPYKKGDGSPGDKLNFTYQLRIPIKVKEKDATIKFDEIVLVEPGEAGAPFGSEDFFDYVVVEGSKDGGVTWITVADGWDSRENPGWLNTYNNSITGQNSTAIGDPSLYRTRTLDLRKKFAANDVVAIRFRLYSDPFAVGWGWSIDNLSIQVDTEPPIILHQHVDYLMKGATQLEIKSRITDNSGLKRVAIEQMVNGSLVTSDLIVNPAQDLFSLTLNFAALKAGDQIQYRIRAVDSVDNIAFYPGPTDFLRVTALTLESPKDVIEIDFNGTASIAGNFFSADTKEGFQNGALHSPHPYLERIGPDPSTSTYTVIVQDPIKVSASNPFIVFDEVVLTSYFSSEPLDYVVVEGTKDGITWDKIIPEHAANFDSKWKAAFDVGGSGSSALFAKRTVKITETGKFKADDVILIRFRLQANNDNKTGWGFAIDNLKIQSIVTGLKTSTEAFSIYPNPAQNNEVFVRVSAGKNDHVGVRLMNAQGSTLHVDEFMASDEVVDHRLDIADLPDGLYLITVATKTGTVVSKFIKGR